MSLETFVLLFELASLAVCAIALGAALAIDDLIIRRRAREQISELEELCALEAAASAGNTDLKE